MAKKKKALLLRISPDLWESLNRWAKHELRSVNAQIEYILRDAVRRRSGQRLPQSPPAGAPEAEQPQPPKKRG